MAQVNLIAAKRPYKGTPVGGAFTASAKDARVLTAIGRATYQKAAVEAEGLEAEKPTPAPRKTPAKKTPGRPVAKRAYTRRDMVSE